MKDLPIILTSETVECKPRMLKACWTLETIRQDAIYYIPKRTRGGTLFNNIRTLLTRLLRAAYTALIGPVPHRWIDCEEQT